jgi:hypothetical protein
MPGVRPNREARRTGYRRQRKLFRLEWPEGHELHGLVVRARSVPIEGLLDLLDAASGIDLGSIGDLQAVRAEAVEAVRLIVDTFAGALVDWSLQDEDGTPVPATAAGLRGEEPDLLMALLEAWMDAVVGVSAPLGRPSPAGEPSLEASLPMAPPSTSQPS